MLAVSCGPAVTLTKEDRKLPDEYLGLDRKDTFTVAKLNWTEFFPDKYLHYYINLALENNYSFQSALERVRMARQEVRFRKGEMFPSVYGQVGAGIEKFGSYTMDGVGNSTTNGPDLPTEYHIPDPYRDFSVGLSFRWEADIWGKLNSRRKASVHRWMASAEAVRLARSYLIKDLANNYFRLIGLDYFRDVIEDYIKETEEACKLTAELKESGEETQLAVDQFDARLYQLKGLLLENEADIKATERAMSLLMGVLPQGINRIKFSELQEMYFRQEIGNPADLLVYRPDILIAENELEAARLDADAARKGFLPSLTIGAGVGFNAFDAAFMFLSPASLIYNIAAGLTAPIFRAGEIRTNYEKAKGEQILALNNYFEVVLNAYQEVVGVVTDIEITKKQQILKEQELKSYRNASENAKEMFHLQYAGYLDVLSAEEKYFDCRLEYMELQMKYCRLMVDLYRALGGGADACA